MGMATKYVKKINNDEVKNMYKKTRLLKILGIVITVLFCVCGCGNNGNSNLADNKGDSVSAENNNENKDNSATETVVPSQEEDEKATSNIQTVTTDLKPSEGFKFESNGDGTCTIVGIGICTDKDIVIPDKSPEGDTITSIGKNSFYGLEDVDSITLVNYNYEVDKNAFQYGEFTTLNIIGGSPVIKKSAFSSCDDLKTLSFRNCSIQADEYAFYGCGKDAEVSFSECTGVIGDRAFQYGDFTSLTIRKCELEFDKSAFSSCEDLTSILFEESTIKTEEYAFYNCGKSAVVEMNNCSLAFDDRAFQYGSFESLSIAGSKIEMGDSVFSSCEDLTAVYIASELLDLGKYSFYNCEDLQSVTICNYSKSDNEIIIDDRAFQYCKRLKSMTIENGAIEIGKYVFTGCADNFALSIAGKSYTAEAIKDGIKVKK